MTDLFGIFKEYGWGYGLWNFEGAFGIIGHHRPGAHWEDMDGYQVDRELFELMVNSRVAAGG
jgi:endoglucanase